MTTGRKQPQPRPAHIVRPAPPPAPPAATAEFDRVVLALVQNMNQRPRPALTLGALAQHAHVPVARVATILQAHGVVLPQRRTRGKEKSSC